MADPAPSTGDFVHLHVHSQYSFLDGAIRVKDLVKRAKDMGLPAVALTDHGNMFGAITFYKACKEAGIKAVLGCELNVLHTDKKDARKDPNSGHGKHLVALARNEEGYRNLIKLVSMGWVEGKSNDGVPRIDLDLLSQHTKGLIGLSGCMGGGVAQAVLEQGEDAGRKVAAQMKEMFEPGKFFLELQDHGFPEQPILNNILRGIGKELDLPRVATNDAHYGKRDDASAHLYLCCIGAGKTIEAMKEGDHGSQEIYLKPPAEMAQTFRDDPEALKNTLAITEMIELKLKLGIPMLPNFQVPEGMSVDDYFRHVAREGLERRFKEFEAVGKTVDHAAYRKRLEWEADVIVKMKFPGYFLIVWDFIRYGKENGVPVGPGRGSGAGSLVAYAMRITDLDPIPYALLFERFLNPERVSMPDFDVDFCMDRRGRVIEYVAQKYGTTSVGQIATFAELKAKSVIKDVGRTMGVPPAETQRLANLIPMKGPGQTYTIPESLEREPKLVALRDTDPRIKELLDQATKLEGLTRQAGMHAAGVVISEGPLWDHVPCFTGANGELVTQYYKEDVEQAGLVKFDFLGLKTLTVLDIAVRLINDRPDVERGGKPFVLEEIAMDDEQAFKLLQTGETKGVFQLESSGMQNLFKDLKPTSFEDIVAAVALYRPGPLGTGMVKDFVDCKHGRKPITSLHPKVDDIVQPTYGVIVYQEQVMQIAQQLAGYSLGGADLLRRAMGKKKPEEMAKQKGIFVEGSLKNDVKEEDAVRIFELLEYFAGYGFNKCVAGSTTIVDAHSGERTTVKELFHSKRAFTVHALEEQTGKLRPRAVTDVVWNGRKRVYDLRTAQGKRIVATANHPFYTLDGWKNLGDLCVGERIAAPRRLAVDTTARWPEHEIVTLAGLLSEGNTCHPTCLYFYNNGQRLVDDFVRAVTRFDATVARIRERGNRLEVCVSTGADRRFHAGQVPWNARVAVNGEASSPKRSGAFAWADSLGLLGVKATNKRVPSPVFTLCDDDVALFLGRLWSGDGFIANATNHTPFYATSSEHLAIDVQTLLLRVGIVAGIHRKVFKYRGTERVGYTVHVVGDGSLEAFLERIAPHCVGRDEPIAELARYVAETERGRTSKDTVPAEIRAWVDEERRARGLTWTQLEADSGVSMKEFVGNGSANKSGFRRSTVDRLARHFGSERLAVAAGSDVFWDRIVSIEPRGIEDTFDLTVDEDHNFVADGLVVHNSHSAAYGLITYQTAYLKAHFPVEFMCASMSADKEKIDKVVRLIAEGRAMGVKILSPDINESDIDFSVVYATPEGDPKLTKPPFGFNGTGKVRDKLGPRIRFGLGAVRGLGESAIQAILEARQSGPFRDMFDFAARVDAKRVNKGVFEALVHSGAMDSILQPLAVSRSSAAASIELALERSKAATKDRNAGQADMFGLFAAAGGKSGASASGDKYIEAAPWDSRELLSYEKKALGFYLSGHPLDRYGRLAVISTADVADQQERAKVKLAGMVEGYRERPMKTGSGKMAFFELEDRMGRIEVKVRPQQVEAFSAVLSAGEPVVLKGMVAYDRRNQDEQDEENATEPTPQILLDEAHLLSNFIRTETRAVLLRIAQERARNDQLQKLAELLRTCRGGCPVTLTLLLEDGAEVQLALGPEFRVEASDPMLAGLERLFGDRVAELRTA